MDPGICSISIELSFPALLFFLLVRCPSQGSRIICSVWSEINRSFLLILRWVSYHLLGSWYNLWSVQWTPIPVLEGFLEDLIK